MDRSPLLRALAAGLAGLALLPAAAAAALTDSTGAAIPNTSWTGREAQLDGAPACRGAASARTGCRALGQTGSPADDDAAALAALGRATGPEDDLAGALDAMAGATDAAAAVAARDEALAILEGDPLPGRAYSGLGLLNDLSHTKVRRVPAGGTVDVREVRTGERTLTDTWLLDFADPSRPYTIRYHVTELGPRTGGLLAPVPLLADGSTVRSGLQSALVPLTIAPLTTGTSVASRFTAARGFPSAGAGEETRVGEQEVAVKLPPAGQTRLLLDPVAQPGAGGLVTFAPATDERLAAVELAFGLDAAGPTRAQRDAAIRRLAAASPERQLWEDLEALPDGDDLLAAAKALGAQDRQLVAAMRSGSGVPAGVATDATADVTVVLQNNRAIASAPKVRLAAGAKLRVQVVNRDGFTHHVGALALTGRRQGIGTIDWGRFDWSPLDAGDAAALETGISRTVELSLRDDAFRVWLGDADTGEQASASIELDRGPRSESVALSDAAGSLPAHAAQTGDGALWVALAGTDAVVRVQAGDDLAAATRTTVLMPGGHHTVTSAAAPLGPTDVEVDGRGILWVTLALGNGIARIDPAKIKDGTGDGVTVYPLTACAAGECKGAFPPEPGETPTREPLQMAVTEDTSGDALVWFTEMGTGRIGLVRVGATGTLRGQTHYPTGLAGAVPLGIALDADGGVWFTEAVNNRIGRLVPGTTSPWTASDATVSTYKIPSAVATDEPELAGTTIMTSNPHSIAIDARGRIWFTESATAKLGLLDPARAKANTSDGFSEFALPDTPFGAAATPADLTFDRAGSVFWADEYGDAVGQFDATATDAADWRFARTFTPSERKSLTDSPVAAANGDLWFVESGSGVLTRVSRVTAGTAPVARPASITLDTRSGSVVASGLGSEPTGVRVDVVRGSATVGSVTATVADGAFRADAGSLRAGDRVRVTPTGRTPLATRTLLVPALDGRAAAGTATGRALLGGEPVAGAVQVELDGSAAAATVDPTGGSWSLTGLSGVAQTVSYTQALPGALVRTIAALTQPVAAVTPGPSGSGTPTGAPAVTPAAVAATPAPQGGTSSTTASSPAGGCRTWLGGSAKRPVPAFLGTTERALPADCLGAPRSRTARGATVTLSYQGGLTLTLTKGRVTRVVITGRDFTSATGGLRVGAGVSAVRAALAGAKVKSGRVRVDLRSSAGTTEIRVALDPARKTVTRIDLRRSAR